MFKCSNVSTVYSLFIRDVVKKLDFLGDMLSYLCSPYRKQKNNFLFFIWIYVEPALRILVTHCIPEMTFPRLYVSLIWHPLDCIYLIYHPLDCISDITSPRLYTWYTVHSTVYLIYRPLDCIPDMTSPRLYTWYEIPSTELTLDDELRAAGQKVVEELIVVSFVAIIDR